jgi:hypothetical protein
MVNGKYTSSKYIVDVTNCQQLVSKRQIIARGGGQNRKKKRWNDDDGIGRRTSRCEGGLGMGMLHSSVAVAQRSGGELEYARGGGGDKGDFFFPPLPTPPISANAIASVILLLLYSWGPSLTYFHANCPRGPPAAREEE